jgi:hypothetical protein
MSRDQPYRVTRNHKSAKGGNRKKNWKLNSLLKRKGRKEKDQMQESGVGWML